MNKAIAKLLSLSMAAALMLCTAGATAKTPTGIALTYRPLLGSDGHSFDTILVTLRFDGTESGVTIVDLPDEWGGFQGYYRQITALGAEGATLAPTADPAKVELHHAPGAAITLSYRVSGIDGSEKLTDGATVNEYRPIVRPAYFHLIGEAVVARPEHLAGNTPARVAIEGMPSNTAFASDLQHVHLTLDTLVESIAVGGDFRIIEAGGGARLAVRGRFDARDDAAWTDAFHRIAAAVSGYWNSGTGPYLVTILPFEPSAPGSSSIGGTGRGDAFAFFATTNAEPGTLDRIMAHEMTHSWVPGRIGGIVDGPRQAEDYWLSEGFTDFASWRALVRAGLWTPERYVEEVNAALGEYDRSPLRAMPNIEAAAAFWSNGDAQRLAYLRGMIFAHWLDREAARYGKGGSARAILLAMQDSAHRDRAENAVALLRREAAKRRVPIDAAIERHIGHGVPIDLAPDILAPCATLRVFDRPRFHRGFDVAKTQAQGGIIAGVIEGGPAWTAGMRDGMKLIERRGGQIGDSQIEITYAVDDGGVAKLLRYLPQAPETERVRKFELADLSDGAARQACMAMLGH